MTTANPDAALSFGAAEQMDHSARYVRDREFYDVVNATAESVRTEGHLRSRAADTRVRQPLEALKRSLTVTSFEPITLLSALAAITERIGLVATTTYNTLSS